MAALDSLFIHKLSEPILVPQDQANDANQRASDVSSSGQATPENLQADLIHYKELFTKLRFSYVEQVTKEKFLRAVVGEPPLYVTPGQNADLEEQLRSNKEQLKQTKQETADLVLKVEAEARKISDKYAEILASNEELARLPVDIEQLKTELARLHAKEAATGADPSMSLPLSKTVELVDDLQAESKALDDEIELLEQANRHKEIELQHKIDDLVPLQARRIAAVNAAEAARRHREQGLGGEDALEVQGRWLRGVESTMKSLLEVEA